MRSLGFANLLTVLAAVSFAVVASARVAGSQVQNPGLSVRLLDAETRMPLAGVLVSAVSSTNVVGPLALSSPNGSAIVKLSGTGPFRLLVRHIGFAPVTTDPIAVPVDAATVLDVSVTVRRITLSSVKVLGTRACTAKTESPSSDAAPIWGL